MMLISSTEQLSNNGKCKSKSKKSKKTLFNVGMFKQITLVSNQDGH